MVKVSQFLPINSLINNNMKPPPPLLYLKENAAAAAHAQCEWDSVAGRRRSTKKEQDNWFSKSLMVSISTSGPIDRFGAFFIVGHPSIPEGSPQVCSTQSIGDSPLRRHTFH
jgi:hypothetical protein